MIHASPSQLGLVKLGDSGLVLRSPAQDLRGKDAYGVKGGHIGTIEDLYVDVRRRKVLFLELEVGGVLGLGRKTTLVPAESVAEITEDRVIVRSHEADGPADPPPFDTALTLPEADYRPPINDDPAERIREALARFHFGSWPY
jgi:sporulation protein YlmC with PRC-barrel domain